MADNQRWFNHILKNKLIGATKVALIFINYTKSIKGEITMKILLDTIQYTKKPSGKDIGMFIKLPIL